MKSYSQYRISISISVSSFLHKVRTFQLLLAVSDEKIEKIELKFCKIKKIKTKKQKILRTKKTENEQKFSFSYKTQKMKNKKIDFQLSLTIKWSVIGYVKSIKEEGTYTKKGKQTEQNIKTFMGEQQSQSNK